MQNILSPKSQRRGWGGLGGEQNQINKKCETVCGTNMRFCFLTPLTAHQGGIGKGFIPGL